MSKKDIIVVKLENQIVPQAYLERVVNAAPAAFNYSALAPTAGKLTKATVQQGKADLKLLMDAQKVFEKSQMVMWFTPHAIKDARDEQPYTLAATEDVQGNESLDLLVFAAGDFTGILKEGCADSATVQYMADYLFPEMNELSDILGGDVNKIVSHIREKEFFRKKLTASCNEHCSLVLMDSLGIAYPVVLKPSNQAQFTWGWANDALGWTGKVEATPATAPAETVLKKKVGGFDVLKNHPAAATNDNVPKTDTTSVPIVGKVTMVKVTFPPRYNHKDRAQLVRNCFHGNLDKVPNYKNVDHFLLDVKTAQALEHLGKLTGVATEPVEVPKSNPVVLPSQIPAKQEPAKQEPAKKVEPAPNKEAAKVFPVVEPRAASELAAMMKASPFKEIIDASGNLIMDPAAQGALSNKYPPLFGKIGLRHINQTIGFEPVHLKMIADKDPMALVTHCMNLAAAYVGSLAEIRRLEELVTAPKTEEVIVQEPKKKVGGFRI